MYLEIDFESIRQEMYTLIKIMDAEGNVNKWPDFFFSPHGDLQVLFPETE